MYSTVVNTLPGWTLLADFNTLGKPIRTLAVYHIFDSGDDPSGKLYWFERHGHFPRLIPKAGLWGSGGYRGILSFDIAGYCVLEEHPSHMINVFPDLFPLRYRE